MHHQNKEIGKVYGTSANNGAMCERVLSVKLRIQAETGPPPTASPFTGTGRKIWKHILIFSVCFTTLILKLIKTLSKVAIKQ